MPESRRRWLHNTMASTAEEEAHLMGDEQEQSSFDDDRNPLKKTSLQQRRKVLLILIYGGIGLVSILLIAVMYVHFCYGFLTVLLLLKDDQDLHPFILQHRLHPITVAASIFTWATPAAPVFPKIGVNTLLITSSLLLSTVQRHLKIVN